MASRTEASCSQIIDLTRCHLPLIAPLVASILLCHRGCHPQCPPASMWLCLGHGKARRACKEWIIWPSPQMDCVLLGNQPCSLFENIHLLPGSRCPYLNHLAILHMQQPPGQRVLPVLIAQGQGESSTFSSRPRHWTS